MIIGIVAFGEWQESGFHAGRRYRGWTSTVWKKNTSGFTSVAVAA
jgi:hypothetical protein